MAGYGMKSHVLVNFQNSFGTSQVTSQEAIAITNENVVFGIGQITEAGMYARFAESPYHDGAHSVEGDITQEGSPISLGWFLKSAIGLTSTTSDTNTQTHVFKPRTSDFCDLAATNPATIEIHRDVGSAGLYYDLCGNTLALDIANGELLTATLGVLGSGGFTKKAAGSPTFPTAKPFKWDQFSGSFNGADIVDIQNLTVNINNNLENRYTMQNCQTSRKIKRTGQQIIELTGTITFQQQSYWDAFQNQNELPFVVHMAGAQTPNAITLDFPLLRFKDFSPTIAGPGVIEASFTAGAMFSTTSNTALEVTLVNTQAYY
jgi:hypothetical protein